MNHCWHRTGNYWDERAKVVAGDGSLVEIRVATDAREEQCCWCGELRKVEAVLEVPAGHGPHLTRQEMTTKYTGGEAPCSAA